jgi:hypothetical protein
MTFMLLEWFLHWLNKQNKVQTNVPFTLQYLLLRRQGVLGQNFLRSSAELCILRIQVLHTD